VQNSVFWKNRARPIPHPRARQGSSGSKRFRQKHFPSIAGLPSDTGQGHGNNLPCRGVLVNECNSSKEELAMSRPGFGFRIVVCAALFSAVGALAQHPAYRLAGPVPPAVRAAKKIFLSNAGGDSGLFPEPFSGDPNRGYTELYAAFKAAGQFDLVDDPSEADLVLELQLIAPNGPTNGSKVNGASDPLPMFRLVIYDRETHFVLWTLSESIDPAVGQRNHDRTFDEALGSLQLKFGTLVGIAAPNAH